MGKITPINVSETAKMVVKEMPVKTPEAVSVNVTPVKIEKSESKFEGLGPMAIAGGVIGVLAIAYLIYTRPKDQVAVVQDMLTEKPMPTHASQRKALNKVQATQDQEHHERDLPAAPTDENTVNASLQPGPAVERYSNVPRVAFQSRVVGLDM